MSAQRRARPIEPQPTTSDYDDRLWAELRRCHSTGNTPEGAAVLAGLDTALAYRSALRLVAAGRVTAA